MNATLCARKSVLMLFSFVGAENEKVGVLHKHPHSAYAAIAMPCESREDAWEELYTILVATSAHVPVRITECVSGPTLHLVQLIFTYRNKTEKNDQAVYLVQDLVSNIYYLVVSLRETRLTEFATKIPSCEESTIS